MHTPHRLVLERVPAPPGRASTPDWGGSRGSSSSPGDRRQGPLCGHWRCGLPKNTQKNTSPNLMHLARRSVSGGPLRPEPTDADDDRRPKRRRADRGNDERLRARFAPRMPGNTGPPKVSARKSRLPSQAVATFDDGRCKNPRSPLGQRAGDEARADPAVFDNYRDRRSGSSATRSRSLP
jgi:hypothetical protein